jgi:hypothetical protein
MSASSGWRSYFVSARSWVQIQARRPDILPEVYRGFPQVPHRSVGMVSQIAERQFSRFPTNSSQIILPFVISESIIKLIKNKYRSTQINKTTGTMCSPTSVVSKSDLYNFALRINLDVCSQKIRFYRFHYQPVLQFLYCTET